MSNLFDRAGMSSATTGTGTLTLGAALGAVAPNLCGFLSFAGAGVADQNIVSYLILDAGGAWETGWGIYTASGTTLTRNVTRSSNANSAISLSGNEQVFVTARAEDLATIEALASANLIINGGMDISQENGTNAVAFASTVPKYLVDQWREYFQSTGALAVSGQQVAPPGSPPFGGAFPSCLQLKATTGQASLGSTDLAFLCAQLIEGNRAARLGFGTSAAQAVTVGFWIYATIAGTLSVFLNNGPGTRAYVTTVTINNAATWEWKTVVIPGDTGGTWSGGTAFWGSVGIAGASGGAFQGTLNSWNAANTVTSSSTTNFFATTNNVVCTTGWVMLPGAHQLSQEQSANLARSLDVDLAWCQRYYQKSFDAATAPGPTGSGNGGVEYICPVSATANLGVNVEWKVPMRTAPTLTFYNPSLANGNWRNISANADSGAASAPRVSEKRAFFQNAGTGGAGDHITVNYVADARL